MRPPVAIALIHHPVRDRAGQTITTAVTNLDVHDIARSARTYDLAAYYLVTPIEAQQALVERILEHWRTGAGARRVPERSRALALCRVVPTLEAVRADMEARFGQPPRLLVTEARPELARAAIAHEDVPALLAQGPSVILFGTGHGLATSMIEQADEVIAPIRGAARYNHLSVRAAVAITLDRLFGEAGAEG
jgi:hypothetical protein